MLRPTGHRWGGSAPPTCAPASQPHPLALTSQALRSRCRSPTCVLSARPSKRALGGDATRGSESWERGHQGGNEKDYDAREIEGATGAGCGSCTGQAGGAAARGDTDLSASGGSLQPASPRWRSVPARLRKSRSAAGAARDFLGGGTEQWASGRREAAPDSSPDPPRSVPLTCGRRRSSKRRGGRGWRSSRGTARRRAAEGGCGLRRPED